MNIVLFGFKKSGKSYYGKLLAKKLGTAFIDTDTLLENLFEAEQGKRLSCKEIFIHIGALTFRALESEIILSLQDVQHSVISIGGGAILDPMNTELLDKLGLLVYLDLPKEEIKKRMLEGDVAGYLDEADPEASFERMYEARLEHYEKVEAAHISPVGKKDDEVVSELKALLDGK